MKKIEVKRLGAVSVFKVVLYMLAVPICIFLLIGIIMMIVGAAMGKIEIIGIGALLGIGYPVLFIVLYGLMSMLGAVVYNFLARRFGGLEITVNESEEVL